MKIETKYNIGNALCVLKDNKIHSFVVSRIEVGVFEEYTTTLYHERINQLAGNDRYVSYNEENCFATRKELAESLLKD